MSDAHAERAKTNKPSNSNFRQQRLVAWQPIMSPPHVVACLLVIAVAFTPIGIAILYANKDTENVERRYDDVRKCSLTDNDRLFSWSPLGGAGANVTQGCRTVVTFNIPNDMKAPVYLYYKLTNFYQNHRRFAKSRSVNQLGGENPTRDSMSDCDPLLTPGEITNMKDVALTVNGQGLKYGDMRYSPCGLVAWSMFNDSFTLFRRTTSGNQLICNGSQFTKNSNQALIGAGNCSKDGITWDSDADKFKTPALGNDIWTANRAYFGQSNGTTDKFVAAGWYAGEPGHEVPVPTDQDFQVWMRTAALPEFRKLYRVIHVDLPAGTYEMVIDEFYPVGSFGGTKSFALSTLSWLGGKNEFLAIAYIVVGALSCVLGLLFLGIYKANGDRMQQAIESLNELQ